MVQCACGGKNVIFCFSEIWTRPDGPPFHYPGYHVLSSPFHVRPGTTHLSYLPESCVFISKWKEMHNVQLLKTPVNY